MKIEVTFGPNFASEVELKLTSELHKIKWWGIIFLKWSEYLLTLVKKEIHLTRMLAPIKIQLFFGKKVHMYDLAPPQKKFFFFLIFTIWLQSNKNKNKHGRVFPWVFIRFERLYPTLEEFCLYFSNLWKLKLTNFFLKFYNFF